MRQNFFEFLPFLARYRHDLPFVSLQDAHGEEAWHWVDDLVAHRTVFLAKEPTWEGWQEALKNNWVVSIRHDDFTRGQTRMLGGAPGVQDFVRKTDFYGSDEARRPWASIVVLGSESTFELGRPERGAAIRVRLAGRNTPQAVLTKPLVELLGLHLDGKPLEALRVERKNDKGLFTEIHYRASLPELSSGTYRVSAWLRRLDSGEERTIQEEIRIP
jgi:hypothetical protein